MKRFLQIAAMATVLCGSMLAQRGAGFGPRAAGGGAQTSGDRIANQVARLTAQLELTPAQVTTITGILTNAESASTSLQTTLATDQTALTAAIKSNGTSSIDQLSSAIGVIDGQLLSIRSKADAAVYAALTATQQAKFHVGGGPGGRGPGGPRPPRN